VLFTFYIQGVLKFKKNSESKVLKKFPSYKLILLVGGIFCLEFQ